MPEIGSRRTSSFKSTAAFNRPADTLAYLAGDVVGGALSFPNLGPLGSEIQIRSAQFEWDLASLPAGAAGFRLYLYNAAPPSALADNAPWDLPAGDRASFLGYVDLGTPVDLGSTLYVEVNNIGKHVMLSGSGLSGYLVTLAGFTPASGTAFAVTLHSVAA